MFLSEIIQRFIHGVEPGTYLNTFAISVIMLPFMVAFYRKTSTMYDPHEPNNLYGLLAFAFEWIGHVLVVVIFAAIVGFSYGHIPEAFVVTAPLAILIQRRALD
ncbi:hypothetical protein ACUY3M_00750 [Corynebacterium suicordis]|uniref:Uncharacterized protein n=1 Tax=Corynebacterium suicordis DSM 45110 TaxID=1121369 RepID=A0ABR9ZGV2_9CORY|nr:hypothetical protein [Corynebacterium suicordis]MBF4552640.1 hypothetical protein [Corynebacterium suicordis DSM 45110]MDR6278401.1 hypothetical protein [Corynebacterium suicordis]